jgi:4-hydroxy-2-oxoheptanedioate aldolase
VTGKTQIARIVTNPRVLDLRIWREGDDHGVGIPNYKQIKGENIMRPNRLRERLDAGEPTLGTHLLSTWPTLVELIGQAGNYDYVEFTAEYAPFDLHDLDNLGRALELKDLGGMIKLEQTMWTHQAMRAIGSGFQSVLFADVRTVADAQACVAAVRAETPGSGGRLGVGMRRDVGTVREGGSPAYVKALDEVVIAIMVEKRECVEDLDAILSVKGIDMVQFGGSDYSMSLGLTGQRSHPDVLKAERKTIETALKMGLHPRVELGEITEAARYLEMGVKHFCIGWDVRILHNWWRDNGEGMRAMLADAAPAPASKAAAAKPHTTQVAASY